MGKANLPTQEKYLVTPIVEYSNEYNTYDSQNKSMISSLKIGGQNSREQSIARKTSTARDDEGMMMFEEDGEMKES